ncbi:MAG: FAD-dependent oxidoreductase [SAR86 cluster bacterium]|uniref:FAD-dependent oxidoreductase n=1 Tax=SAR86 cluster bacterium TaxID=2030880 RepID=A0A2A5B7U1_9GAMM|nr:MAG: FAD-dependent oxidoreductase [SAR86 cluster bacterium]
MAKKIIVVGAGVIGAASAMALQADGHEVTLVDRAEPCAGASFGNAGAIVNGSCVPTAMPGIIFDVMRMCFQPLSPLSIRPAYFYKILPWLMRFVWQSRSAAASKNAIHLRALTQHAVESWLQLIDKTTLTSFIEEAGWLKVYEREASFSATHKARKLMIDTGTKFDVLGRAEIHDLEPNLAPIFNYGYYQKDCLRIVNPQKLVQAMVDVLLARGGAYKQFGVESIQTTASEVTLLGSAGTLTADKVVVAAGAWSRSLAKQLGDNIPLDTERGYHLVLPESTRGLLNAPVVNGESSFVLSPMETGMRLSSQVEFAGLDAAPDYSRVRSLLPMAKRMLPMLDVEEQSVWMGFRPSLPDSLPVLGFSSTSKNVLYAFGHQHLGMTMGAVTGRIVSDMIAGRNPIVNMAPYRPDRF